MKVTKMPSGFVPLAHTSIRPMPPWPIAIKNLCRAVSSGLCIRSTGVRFLSTLFTISAVVCRAGRWTNLLTRRSSRSPRNWSGNKSCVGFERGSRFLGCRHAPCTMPSEKICIVSLSTTGFCANESTSVQKTFKEPFKMNLSCVDASQRF